ncbi:Methyltransferase type 11 [Denitrovibrio acetiphilus DSM 12809]|uniref:Methyltransferase type 11 n=1 Tax=Denitrovibrio acetiphilus (strain DSM 12809 / NBRC 114555 / N2460) TaxID=522772 RepID=D4H6P9_DENA2|nr:class I SAM-dependent methyltransferase [Denitrovibrio acetiphilus]ADD67765.1 Methyltransferase type 11 [Denitrovibrio acetiphilus DSM 12809]
MDILENKTKNMWNKKALSYPRYTDNPDAFEAEVIYKIQKQGIDLTKMSILDVGCGSGKFTIGLGKKAKDVHGIDISDEMLRILTEDSANEGVNNITTQQTDWESYIKKPESFDIVFCSTTPAVRSPEDYKTVTEIARQYVIYLGWAGRKDSVITDELYNIYDISKKPFNDTPDVKRWLKQQDIPFSSEVIENDFIKRLSEDVMRDELESILKQAGIKPDDTIIKNIIAKHSDGKTVTNKTYFRRELIIWES